MPSEQEGSPGSSESANASGSQPTALPLFAVQPQNIIPVEIIAKRFSPQRQAPPYLRLSSLLHQMSSSLLKSRPFNLKANMNVN